MGGAIPVLASLVALQNLSPLLVKGDGTELVVVSVLFKKININIIFFLKTFFFHSGQLVAASF